MVSGVETVSSGVASIATQGGYNPSTNKLATMNDVPTESTVSGWGFTKNAGSVTSVGIQNATNGGLSISGSPITRSGTITIGLDTAYGDTKNPYGTKVANYILAAPSGSNGTPSFRALDI